MSSIIISTKKALPISIDVSVNVSKPQIEQTVDLSTPAFLTPNATFDQSANRIRYYDSLLAVAADFVASSEAYKAATAFFSQSPRANTLAIARIFESPCAGFLECGSYNATLSAWEAVTDGSFALALDSVTKQITGLNFSACAAFDGSNGVVDVINDALNAAVSGTTCVNDNGRMKIISATPGDLSSVSFLIPAVVTTTTTSSTSTTSSTTTSHTTPIPAGTQIGTDISGIGFMNGAYLTDSAVQNAYVVPGYAPALADDDTFDITGEAQLVMEAAACSGKFVYGWSLDKKYRDTQKQVDLATWAEAQDKAILALLVNSPMAKDADSTSDVGAICDKNGYTRSFVTYHDNPYYYPDVAALAVALSVNYAAANSTITMKFKDLAGIPTVPMTETELIVLQSKNINTFTLVGNNARTYREGIESNTSWYIDDRINLDNFSQDLQVNVYNMFLLKGKIPLTAAGTLLLNEPIKSTCDLYVTNGTFADRPATAAETTGDAPAVLPAYTINFGAIKDMSASDRGKRKGPPCTIDANLAGAIHSLAIQVNAFA